MFDSVSGKWHYPPTEEVMDMVGLLPLEDYINKL